MRFPGSSALELRMEILIKPPDEIALAGSKIWRSPFAKLSSSWLAGVEKIVVRNIGFA